MRYVSKAIVMQTEPRKRFSLIFHFSSSRLGGMMMKKKKKKKEEEEKEYEKGNKMK